VICLLEQHDDVGNVSNNAAHIHLYRQRNSRTL